MPAPFGNQNAVGNEGGRPPYYESPEELQQRVDEYFEHIKGKYHYEKVEVLGKDGEPEYITEKIWDVNPEPPTVTGLTLFLGFSDRSSLKDYEEKVEFSHILK